MIPVKVTNIFKSETQEDFISEMFLEPKSYSPFSGEDSLIRAWN